MIPVAPTGRWSVSGLVLALSLGATPVCAATPLAEPIPAVAGPAPAPAAFSTKVRFVNLADLPRREWGYATVPFPQGVWTQGRTFAARTADSELTPFGARWPDGSVRYAQLTVWLDLAPHQETLVEVIERTPPVRAFQVSSWLARRLGQFTATISVLDESSNLHTAGLRFSRTVHDGVFRKVLLFQARIPKTDLVYDLWLTLLHNQDHVPFELRVTASRAGSQSWLQNIKGLYLTVNGAAMHIRAAARRGVLYGPMSASGNNVAQLLGETSLFDGQGQDWLGDLMFFAPTGQSGDTRRTYTLMATMHSPLYGVSVDWAASGAVGPFGYVPPAPPWITDGGRAAAQQRRKAYEAYRAVPGDPWDDWPLGLIADAGSPGDQQDFGAIKMTDVYFSGLPHRLEELRVNASEEACRPVHHRENGSRCVKSANHANWVSWDGRTHFNIVVSPDRLGKPSPAAYPQAHGWLGRDNEHWSSLTLASAYLLTGSESLLSELENEAELYISSHTLPSLKPSWSTNALGAARAVGRTFNSMAWNYLCTGRQDLKVRMAKRAREIVAQQTTANNTTGPVKPLAVAQPDPRLLPTQPHWKPWEDSQAVLGLEACYRVTGAIEARQVAVEVARTALNYGWKLTPTETIIATAVGWHPGGVPLTPQQYQDPTWILWSYGTGFSEWSLPAIKLSVAYGMIYNDASMVTSANYILGELIKGRSRPPAGGWDRFADWDAVQ